MENTQSTIGAEEAFSPITHAELESIADESESFVGNWHHLISTTNWEKGQIIHEWRNQLKDTGASARLYSDPAWSRLVGEVSAQHVGRLRRTYDRFGSVHGDYAGLHWSHFYAALDWNDAEMWLEGAVQNKWSVAKMRFQRWETLGSIEEQKPDVLDIIVNPDDEGVSLVQPQKRGDETVKMDDRQDIQGPMPEGPDFGDGDERDPAIPLVQQADQIGPAGDSANPVGAHSVDIEQILAELPANVSKSFRDFRAAVEQLKQDDWKTVKRIKIVALINDLKQVMRNPPHSQASAENAN